MAIAALLAMPTQDASAACTPLPPGAIGWWSGEGNANDVLGLNNGTNVLGVGFAAGEVGQAFVFNGTNNYIQIPDSSALSPHVGSVGELTIEAWIFLPRLPQFDAVTGQANRSIVVKGSPGQWEYGLFMNTNGVPTFNVWQANGNVYSSATGISITTNVWHHLAGVLNKGQYVRLYVDGQLVSEATSFSGNTSDGTSPLFIGRRGDGQNLDGMVDEVTVYGRDLSSAEIAGIFAAGASGKCVTVAGAAVPYQTDFENGIGPEWMQPTTDNSESIVFTRFSGQFDNGGQMLTLTNLVPGQSYTLGFDFYALDSWDGGSSDYLNVAVNGSQLFHYTFANYNVTQTYPGSPDEGSANYGFNQGYADAVYRNIEVTFTATNAITQIGFAGQNLEGIGNESWGVDNVSVRLSSELTNTFVRSTTLPPNGTTNSQPIETFTISANWPLAAASTNAGNFSLRSPGGDGTFGSGDDVIVPLTISSPGTGGRSIAFALNNPPLQPGRYQFQASGLQGTNASSVPTFTREFYIVAPIATAIEGAGNTAIATSTALPLTESPASSGFFSAFATGTFSAASDVDYWRFDAEAGDVVTVRLEAESQGIYSHIRIRNSADADLSGATADANNTVELQNYTINTPGTYYVRVWNDNYRARYGLRLTISRPPSGPQTESEVNDTQIAADPLALAFSLGLAQARMAGALPTTDAAGDYYRLGTLNPGNAINVTALYPSGATLTASQTLLTIQSEGNSVALVTNTTGNLNFTVGASGVHYLRIESTNRSLRAQYLLNVSISDGVPPLITATSFPTEGGSTNGIIDRFSLQFSEDLFSQSVSNVASYDLRAAGLDGNFGTPDDSVYSVVTTGYANGLTAGYTIADGPLQPGSYRFTATTTLTDRAGNHMASAFVRNFIVTSLPGIMLETRNNDVPGLATPLSLSPGTNGDGTLSWVQNLGTANNPRFVATGNFNSDTNLDLVVANWSAGNVTVFTNTGNGLFQTATSIATGANPVAIGVADFNGDNVDDVAVVNYNANTVSILLGSGNGLFTLLGNLTGFSNPNSVVAGDVNNDGKRDLVVPNYGAGNVQVRLGNGDGTFQSAVAYTTGSGAIAVALGDLTGDGKPDLAVANYNSSTVSLLTNSGTGTFANAANLSVGPNPRYVAIGDVTGEGTPDLTVLQSGDNSLAVLAGNGDGTFQARRSYLNGSTDAYQFQLADLNGDGRQDIVIAGYGNNQLPVLLNNGAGIFTNLYGYAVGQNPVGVTVGDFNQDGRLDAAFAHYYGNYVSVWYGNTANLLSVNPAGSGLRTVTARGIRSSSSDVDYFQFTGNAGDQAILAVDTIGNPSASGLRYWLEYWDGNDLTWFDATYNGWGQSAVVTLPKTGTYFVRVASAYYDYQGEYRIRVTLAAPPIRLESEGNDTIASANLPAWVRSGNQLQATNAGYLSVGDGGDYYQLGHLSGGNAVTFTVRAPSSSGLAGILSVYNAAGALMTNSPAGATNFTFMVPTGQDGLYYASLTAGAGGFTAQSAAALRLSGGSDYVTLGGNWFSNQVFTLSLWVNPAASQNQYADLIDNNHQAAINWVVEQNNTTANQYIWGAADGSSGITFNLTPNTWQQLTITRDATNINRVYLNGVLVGTSAGSGQINYNGNQSLNLGRWGAGGRTWNGMISDLRMWDHALTGGEVAASMAGILTGNEPGLLGYWPLNEGFGASSSDLSPANHPAILVNNAGWSQLGPTNSMPPGLRAEYLLSFDASNSVPPQITGDTLPDDGAISTNMISAFTVNFNEFMDPAFAKLARAVYKFGGHTYLLTDTALSWADAEAAAVTLGGHLASITNSAENLWLAQTFDGAGDLWIGLNQLLGREYPAWTSGDPYQYSNWSGGEPNNSSGYEYAVRFSDGGNGTWYDAAAGGAVRGIIEVPSANDADGDGLVDSLDPYPNDAVNAFDLRAAGSDGQFDTGDDVIYRVTTTGYTSGLSAGFAIVDGPLQPGSYRFKVTPALQDRFGVPLAAAYVRYFTNVAVSGFITENRRDASGSSTTSLSQSPAVTGDGSFAVSSGIGVGNNPYFITQADVNKDGYLDLAVANYSSANVSILTNDHTGHFQVASNYATGSGAISIATADFNGDANLDLAVANNTANTVSILLGNGTGGFTTLTNIGGFSNPRNLVAADFNQDGIPDLAVPSENQARVTAWFGAGDGNFTNAVNYTVNAGPETVTAGDLNGDGNPDLVVASYNASTLAILLGSPSGNFTVTTNLPTITNPRSVSLADVSGDGKLDALVVNNGNIFSVAFGNGDGTFQSRTDYNLGNSDAYQVLAVDLNNDGKLDIVVPAYGANRLTTVFNNGDGTFASQLNYAPGGNPISATVGDFNLDGVPDIATANYYGGNVWVLFGNNNETLAVDSNGTGLRIAAARGNLADGNDYGIWTFSAVTGDRLFIATENPGDPGGSSLLYRIYYPNGSQWTYFYTDGNGRGSLSLTVPSPGTYTVRVEQSSAYTGEYRLRVTLASPPVQLETEDNGSIAAADAVSLALTNGHRVATMLGYLGNSDGAGDYYALGNLAGGTQISLQWARPANSAVSPILEIYNAAGVLMTNSRPSQTNLVFVTGLTDAGAYFAHLIGTYPSFRATVTNALLFNGNNHYVNLGAWAPSTNWSLEAWVMPTSLPNGRRMILGSESAYRDWSLTLQDGHLAINVIKSGAAVAYADPKLAVPNTWYHMVGTCDGTNALLYINGALVASGPVDLNYLPTPAGARIGSAVCCGEYFPGAITEASIWNRALSPAEVAALVNTSPTGAETGLLGLWNLQTGTGTTLTDLSGNLHEGTLASGPAWIMLAPPGSQVSGLLQQYLLGINLLSTIPPQILAVSLPGEGSTNTGVWDRFGITFSADMAAPTVTNSANYELRHAGADNLFDTADDQFYTVQNSPLYTTGTSASYLVPDGPLQPGRYRFTVSANLTDPVGTMLPAPYVRNFTIFNLPGFVFENRFANSYGQATTLSPNRTNRADGAFTGGDFLGLGSGVEHIAAGLINSDTNMDLVAALWQGGGVAVLTGNGDGTFTVKTNYATGSQARAVALGNFNADANLDLAVANYGANTMTVLLGNGDGTFQVRSNYSTGTQPYYIAVADVNQDGKLDLVTPNWGSANVSVLLGKGDGDFQPAVNYALGGNPAGAAVADVNGDGNPDLFVANYGLNKVNLLFGNGDGTFAPPVLLPVGLQPRAVTLADFNHDTKLDLAVLNGGDNTVSILSGNGDGSYQPRVNYAAGTSDGYEILATDVDLDGWADLVAPGYYNNTVNVLLNRNGGTFPAVTQYTYGNRPVGLAAADFNGDGRQDFAIGFDSGNNIGVLLGNDTQPLTLDALTGLRIAAGRGNLRDGAQADYWSFDAQAGDQIYLASENPNNPAGTGLSYIIYRPDGITLASFGGDYYGRGQIAATCPFPGTYTIRVSPNYSYTGEYRFRVTLAPAGVQVESEGNDSIGAADALSWSLAAGHRQATVLGYYGSADGSDYFQLGSLSAGATLQLQLGFPASSGLMAGISVFNSAGTLVSYSPVRSTNFSFTVPPNSNGTYYAQIWDAGAVTALSFGSGNNSALKFWGNSDWISFTNPIIPAAGDFTVEAWAYATGPSSYREIMSQGSGGNAFYLGTDGANIRAGDGWQSTGVAFPYAGWHHFALVKSSTDTLLYVDGLLAASKGSAIPNPAASTPLRLGRQYGTYGEYWPGYLDEVRIWNVARSATEIQNNVSNRLSGAESGLVGYWRFDEGSGPVVTDASPGGNYGTLQNTPVWIPAGISNAQPAGIFAQYLLNLDIGDSTGANITSVTLPAAGSSNAGTFDRFTLNFTKDVATGINLLNRDVRVFNGHAYTITSGAVSWYDAESQARALGGNLATVNDATENGWLNLNFSGYGVLWLGLNDELQQGNYVWTSGAPFSYTNWDSGQPNNGNNSDYVALRQNGRWADYQNNAGNIRGLIEVAGTDTDGDGLPDTLDPYPNDPYNVFDLRAAGTDGVFDTPDDEVYHFTHPTYSSGTALDFSLTDGPLQPGYYRFLVTGSFADLFGNGMSAPFTQYFTVTNVAGYVFENRSNNSTNTATPLALVEDPPSVKSAAGRGNLSSGSDVDYWSYTGTAGDRLKLAIFVPGSPGGSQFYYRVFRPDGTQLFDYYPSYYGDGETGPYLLPVSGTYTLLVSPNYTYPGEYRFRLTTATPPVQMETEPDDTIATATSLTFTTDGNGSSASIVGRVRVTGDLDYINLGTVTNGSSIFLNIRTPASSALSPIVSVYNALGVYQPEAVGGRPTDGVANVPITASGTYYALVRASGGSASGLNEEYVLDVNVVPTGSVNFPNLVVTSVNPPTGSGILSGQNIVYGFEVANVGSVATAVGNWVDRAVLSTDTTLGNGDDIAMGFFPHSGVLNVANSYSVTNTFNLPDGISGDYYVIVQTDSGNAVNEYLFKGDNITVSSNTFHVNVAPYPDLAVENLAVAGPDGNNAYTISWNTTNRGTATAPAGFYERFTVRNQTTGTLLVNLESQVTNSLAINAALPRLQTLVATNPGVYQVQVVVDNRDGIYEYGGGSHAFAEANNSATNGFQIVAYFNLTVQSSPPGAGALTGGGTYTSGSAAVVTATPITNTLPYLFVNWTEGGAFQSASTNYPFIVSRDRTLTANFTLPAFAISASNNPPTAGVVSGQGTYFYGVTNVLTAAAGFGYRFTNWTENGLLLSQTATLTNIVRSNRLFVANYVEANTAHVVTTATSPTNVATVTGAGTYTNGAVAGISAPAAVTNPPNIYNFKQYQLNGAPAGASPSFNKTFTTLDPTNMQYVAVYDTVSILPLVTNVTRNLASVVPATTNFVLTFQFNRSMDSNFPPLVVLTNPAPATQASVPTGGVWSQTAVSNDTFSTLPITFGPGMDGTNFVWISQGRDLGGSSLALTNPLSFVVDVTPPANPMLALTASNSSSATISWSGYAAPSDLSSFRVYLATNGFTSVTGLTAVTSLGAGARNHTLGALALDRNYYAAVAAVDAAGNSSPNVTPLAFNLPSTVPPPVSIQVNAVGSSSAFVSWNSYNASGLLGFAGFRLYYETTNFSSVAGLGVRQVLSTGTHSVQVDGLDRTRTYYFAVVGFNVNNALNAAVATASWSDPYAGQVAQNTTIGGAGQTVDILQSITVVNNAVVTIPAGTTLRFAPGTGLTVQQGSLNANGTALDPIVFTSSNDQSGFTANPGDWNGIVLGSGTGGSLLRHVFVKYGAGLSVTNVSPTVDAFTAAFNTPAGLTLAGSAVLNTTNALLVVNDVGAQQIGAAQLNIRDSVIKNNGTNALAAGGANLVANQNWWGTAVPAEIDALLRGGVDHAVVLPGEPLLTPALGTVNNVTQVGGQSVNLRLACRTADTMRLSEDSAFTAVFFNTFSNLATFPLSSGGGLKTIFAQFRSVTGQTSAPVSITVNYITAGPTITGFSLTEGQVLSRPLTVTGSASAPLGMAAIELYLDNVGVATNVGGGFSTRLDIRNYAIGVHRAKLLARDNSGNVATRELNITVAPTPPPTPQIVSPANDLVINTNGLRVSGTAEPLVPISLFRSGSLAGSVNAAADGSFVFSSVTLVEGVNQLVAQASDVIGTASSAARQVTLDTVAPAQLILEPPTYQPGVGLTLSWHFPVTGKQATSFRVFWSTVPIANPASAIGSTLPQITTTALLQGLATTNFYFYVVGYDAIGNQSPMSAPVTFAYDAVPPGFNLGFNKPSPVSVGPLHVILTSSEALGAMPTLTVQPTGLAPSLVTLSNTALNTYEADISISTLLPSGPLQFRVTGVDLAGNSFNGTPAGPSMVIDVTPPAGWISTSVVPPVQTTNSTNITVSLELTEVPQTATTPALNFAPPIGASVPVVLTGSGTNWSGGLTLTPAMGSGLGHFTLTVLDNLGNIGHSILSGSALELYNTELPTPPAQPVNFQATPVALGKVQLNWSPVPNAEMYRVYSETGTTFTVPTFLVADNVPTNSYLDLPPADGYYRYVVTAARRGAEGPVSIVRVALSDRTPPSAPTNVVAQLAASGLQISWQAGDGPAPNRYNIYRNGALIRTATTVSPVFDNPPRGILSYTVGAVDALGNESLSVPVQFQMLVGAVANLQAQVVFGQAPALTWTSADVTAIGFNLYRNGIKQNSQVLSNALFADPLPLGNEPVVYAVTAVNSTNAESAVRSVTVYPVDLSFLVNSADGVTSGLPVSSYFDAYQAGVANLATTSAFPLGQMEVQRTSPGGATLNLVQSTVTNISIGGSYSAALTLPSATNSASQAVLVTAVQQSDAAGGTVRYQKSFALGSPQSPGGMVEISANQLPLAGGLTPFSVKVYNRGMSPIYLATTRANGSQPGDVYISVKNPQGQEVSRTPFNGTPTGTIFYGDVGYLAIPGGSSTTFTVPGVLVPDALASNIVTFQAVVSAIYDRGSAAGQQASGPLSGSMESSLTQTPYYGVAQTDFSLYSNDQPIIITGQARDRITDAPVPNATLKIGFATRGYRWYVNVTTDGAGNYSYTNQVTPGLAGTLSIWAAHPLVFDQLNQAAVTIYRIYATPQSGDIRMAQNSTLPFTISLFNPGDQPLAGFNLNFQAYQYSGTNQIPVSTLHGSLLSDTNFAIGPGQRRTITLALTADVNAPTNAVAEFTLASAEGAATRFTGYATLTPAIPILSVVQPDMGYVEVSLNRGSLLSRQIVVANRGLEALKGVTVQPPTNVTWMALNLPTNPDGTISLPDIPVGQSDAFTVVFSPPTNNILGFYQDKLTIRGTNSASVFDVNLYARVTSANHGAAQFYADNILGQDVPNATVRLRNLDLQIELPPVQTDINGLVTVTNLQEGDWSWQVGAAGHSANVGVVNVIADQVVNVSTRLNKSVVTVNFTVVPVPYTDRYEIQLEQTFETHVPLPVLVMTPSFKEFKNVTPGFQASYIVTVKNEGLIQMENLTITGETKSSSSFTPLITYVPVLLPQQTIEVPFTVNYYGTNGPGQQDGNPLTSCLPDPSSIGQNIPAFIDGLRAIANAEGRCIKDNSLLAIAGGVAIGMSLYQELTGLFASIPEQIASYIGCVIGTLLGQGLDAGGGGSAGDGSGSTQGFQNGGASCFAPDTTVLLANGRFKRMDEIVIGDVVRSGTALRDTATVAEVYRFPVTSVREISFRQSGERKATSVVTTDEHLFWVDGAGWTPAAQLKVGDWLLTPDRGRTQVQTTRSIPGNREVLTLKLRDDTAFYAAGVLVHDLCGGLPPPDLVRAPSWLNPTNSARLNFSK